MRKTGIGRELRNESIAKIAAYYIDVFSYWFCRDIVYNDDYSEINK